MVTELAAYRGDAVRCVLLCRNAQLAWPVAVAAYVAAYRGVTSWPYVDVGGSVVASSAMAGIQRE